MFFIGSRGTACARLKTVETLPPVTVSDVPCCGTATPATVSDAPCRGTADPLLR